MEKAADLAQTTYQNGLAQHGHHGRALIESLAQLCRDHPNIVGIGIGFLVEQLLSEEKREHDRRMAQLPILASVQNAQAQVDPVTGEAATPPLHQAAPPTEPRHVRLHNIRPAHLAFEVFGGLLLLKFGLAVGRLFRRKRAHPDGWLASAGRIHLLSASIATYYFAWAIRAEKVSAWRNAAIGLFGTDAIKPLLKARKPLRAAA